MTTWKEISPFTGTDIDEDAPTNAVGTGSVAGLGVGPMGEPGVHPRKKKKNETLMSYGVGSGGSVRPQVDMANIQSAKSPLQKLRDFDKNRVGGPKIFKDRGGNQYYRMKKPGTMTVMNVPERELKKYEKMGYKVVE